MTGVDYPCCVCGQDSGGRTGLEGVGFLCEPCEDILGPIEMQFTHLTAGDEA